MDTPVTIYKHCLAVETTPRVETEHMTHSTLQRNCVDQLRAAESSLRSWLSLTWSRNLPLPLQSTKFHYRADRSPHKDWGTHTTKWSASRRTDSWSASQETPRFL